MAEKPIRIKDLKQTVTSTRQDLYSEEAYKILSKKGFVFSRYDPSKMKAQFEGNKRYHEKDTKTEPNLNNNTKSITEYQITQPIMRFKPRTDLERIYDTLIQFSSFPNNKTKNIIFSQLNSMGLGPKVKDDKTQRSGDMFGENLLLTMNNNNVETINSNSTSNTKTKSKEKKVKSPVVEEFIERDKIKKNMHKSVDNSKAKQLHPDLYNKTYFKAVENYSLFKNSFFIPDKINTKTSKEQKRMMRSTEYRPNKKTVHFGNAKDSEKNMTAMSMNNNNITSPTELITFLNQKNKKGQESNLIKTLDNVDLFTQSLKENLQKKNDIDREKFEKVKQLAFPHYNDIYRRGALFKNPKNEQQKNLDYNFNFDKDYYSRINGLEEFQKKVEEKIVIDGVPYIKSDLEHISTKILEKCKWRHQKIKNDEESFKAGSGKLMFTNGMSILEFEQKYHLKG